ncbi:MAG: molybdopterin-dependent oxidoreductase, partial [Acidimicrobiales bacterium]|nr:molybdopterin-dependent oxidoreductase [Acidimicrobiales bacterium]
GRFGVKGSPDKGLLIQEVAWGAFSAHNLPDGMEPNINEQMIFDPPNFAFPFGTHVVVLEVDEHTGEVELLDYIAVDDCGNQVNPLIVEGQLHGGIVQGMAQALYEGAVYDEDGNCTNPSFLDYLVPSPMEMCNIQTDHTTTPSTSNVMGVKGVGEAGTIGSAAAVINGICDALGHLGIDDMKMPASPMRVWKTIQEAKANGGVA